jgi:hypothetical protein
MFAPVLVSTNLQHLNISWHKAQLWGAKHKTYVSKWKTYAFRPANKPSTLELYQLQQNHSFFGQFWVPGTPSYLGFNINPGLGLVNGCPTTAHSLTFSHPQEYERVLSLIQGPNALPFGFKIDVELPVSVNR